MSSPQMTQEESAVRADMAPLPTVVAVRDGGAVAHDASSDHAQREHDAMVVN